MADLRPTYGELNQRDVADWLGQFSRDDHGVANKLLSAIRNVSEHDFRTKLTNLLDLRISSCPDHIALFVETERRRQAGRPDRLFSESRNKIRRAYGGGPPIVKPLRTVNPEVGSEGLIAHIVSQVYKKNRQRITIHPGPDIIRQRSIRRFILITDLIGTGDRALHYLESAWRVRSVRSWWSARRTRGLSFEVVAYAATESGRRRVENHPCKPSVHIVEGCRTLETYFERPQDRERMISLCRHYGSFDRNSEPLGYGGLGTLISFAHGMPNNAPIIFYKKSKLKKRPWWPLYPERVTTGHRSNNNTSMTGPNEIKLIDLETVNHQHVLRSPRFISAPVAMRDAIRVLLSLKKAPRTELTISERTGFTVAHVRLALRRIRKYGWVDRDLKISKLGFRELSRLVVSFQEPVHFMEADLYIPSSLRAPRSPR